MDTQVIKIKSIHNISVLEEKQDLFEPDQKLDHNIQL